MKAGGIKRVISNAGDTAANLDVPGAAVATGSVHIDAARGKKCQAFHQGRKERHNGDDEDRREVHCKK